MHNLTKEELKELCNRYTADDLKQAVAVFTIARCASLSTDDAIDVLVDQNCLHVKNPNERRGRPRLSPEQKAASYERYKERQRERRRKKAEQLLDV